jgi:glycine cleavage system aminomethyltransferase T
MDPFTTGPKAEHDSPLEDVVMRHGATMINRHGRSVAAHYGSPAGEAAVCRSTVGIADRSDRTTLELRGAPADVELALSRVVRAQIRNWWSRLTARSAIVRCEQADTARCLEALIPVEGTVEVELSNRYAAIAVIGPRAVELLAACAFKAQRTPPIVLREAEMAFEVLVPSAEGPARWEELLAVGVPFQIACVGLDALAHLAASRRLDNPVGATLS